MIIPEELRTITKRGNEIGLLGVPRLIIEQVFIKAKKEKAANVGT